MDNTGTSIVLQWVLPICFLAIALITATFGAVLLKPSEVSTSESTHKDVPYHRFYGFLLILSAIGWIGLGTGTNHWAGEREGSGNSVALLQQLPSTAAGISVQESLDPGDHSAKNTAMTAMMAESLAESPHDPEFQKLRKQVTDLLFAAEGFDSSDDVIKINLSNNEQGDTIKYLADERPGLLTVIYHRKFNNQPQMVVYFPEVVGNLLIYTPLSGPASPSVSKVVTN